MRQRLGIMLALVLFPCTAVLAQATMNIGTPGGVLAYREFGSGGTPLMIVGGLAGVSSDYLIPLATEFGKRGRTILIDQPGTGGSRVANADTVALSAAAVIRDCEALRSTLKIDRWIVFGHSWGGTVALQYAGVRPKSIAGLVVVGPVGYDLRIFDYYNVNIMSRMSAEDSSDFNLWSNTRPGDPMRTRAKIEQFRAMLGGYLVDRTALRFLRTAITEQTYSPVAGESYWRSFMDHTPPLLDILPSFKAPSVIIQGDQDPVDRRTADRVRKGLRVAEFREIPKCGAFPWMERPQEFWKAMDRFLAKVPKKK